MNLKTNIVNTSCVYKLIYLSGEGLKFRSSSLRGVLRFSKMVTKQFFKEHIQKDCRAARKKLREAARNDGTVSVQVELRAYKLLVALLFCVFFKPVFSQEMVYQNKHIGFNIGANFALGSHFQRLGLNFNFYYVNGLVQLNSEARTYFSFKNLGPKIIYNELVLSQGVVFGYGSNQTFFNPFVNSISNQTGYKNSIAYSYNIYLNKIKTSQVTGIAAFQFNKISVIIENDILAKPMLDRFRTGAFLIQYQYLDVFQAAINCTMWTGKMGNRMDIENSNIYYKCYMDTVDGIYPNISHGLLSAQFKYNVGFSQNMQVNVGVDAEQVRNVVQNKFIHDMKFLPQEWNKAKNCHIPMIDKNGNQYLYQANQKIKQPKLYWNFFSNANVFY